MSKRLPPLRAIANSPLIQVFLGCTLCCLPVFASIVPPMTDISAHVLVARIIEQYVDPSFDFGRYFSVEWRFVPTSLAYAALVALQKVFTPYAAARVYLVISVFAMAGSGYVLARQLGSTRPQIPALWILPLSFSWFFWMGFLPYVMTFSLFASAIAIWISLWPPYAKIVGFCIISVLLFGFHVVAACTAGISILLISLANDADPRPLIRRLVEVLIAGSPVGALTIAFVLGSGGPSHAITYTSPVDQLLSFVHFTCASLAPTTGFMLWAWAGFVGGLGALCAWHRRIRFPILVCCVILIIIGIALPVSLGALWPAGPRLFPFVLLLLITAIPWDERFSTIATGTALTLLAAMSASTTWYVRDLDADQRDFVSGIPFMRPGARLLPILTDPGEGSHATDPFWTLASAYTIAKGGENPYVFASPYLKTAATPLRYKSADYNRFAFLFAHGKAANDYQGITCCYDYVLLWGTNNEISTILSGELALIHHQGRLRIYANRLLASVNHKED